MADPIETPIESARHVIGVDALRIKFDRQAAGAAAGESAYQQIRPHLAIDADHAGASRGDGAQHNVVAFLHARAAEAAGPHIVGRVGIGEGMSERLAPLRRIAQGRRLGRHDGERLFGAARASRREAHDLHRRTARRATAEPALHQ